VTEQASESDPYDTADSADGRLDRRIRRRVIGSEDADYERFNLARDAVAPWEDGARTDNRRGTYEWWYFDAHLDDGSSLVVVFMNKDLTSPNDPLTPTIRIDLDLRMAAATRSS
jgi:hypothetical protein